MAGYNKTPKQLRVDIPEDLQDTFGKFNTLCVVQEKRPATYLAELIADELRFHGDVLEKKWLSWDEFESAMSKLGFSFTRTTFWSYRKAGKFPELVKTDGVTTLYQLDGFIKFFQGNGNGKHES